MPAAGSRFVIVVGVLEVPGRGLVLDDDLDRVAFLLADHVVDGSRAGRSNVAATRLHSPVDEAAQDDHEGPDETADNW